MKKTLLLSVVASTMIMAGGDIAPVEPVVEAPAVEAAGWEFGGNAVAYYQTMDGGDLDLFDADSSLGNTGVQLRATNADLVAGIGAGVEVNGLAELPFVADYYSQNPTDDSDHAGGWISQAYLTYGFGNTSIKVGRQELPKTLSPFAFSENWNVFANTFDAALVVNTDITDTAVVYAFVKGANFNSQFGTPMNQFDDLNENDGVHLLTVQNKSIANLTLTGSVYYAQDMNDANLSAVEDVTMLWGDAAYDAGAFGVAIQGGQIDFGTADDMTAFGAKVTGAVSGINLMAAYSDVEDGLPFQLGGTTSALYTTTIVNQLVSGLLEVNANKIVLGANTDVLGGNISAAYAMTDSDITGDTNEFNLAYSTNLTDSVSLTAAYANIDLDAAAFNTYAVAQGEDITMSDDTLNVVRIIANYKF